MTSNARAWICAPGIDGQITNVYPFSVDTHLAHGWIAQADAAGRAARLVFTGSGPATVPIRVREPAVGTVTEQDGIDASPDGLLNLVAGTIDRALGIAPPDSFSFSDPASTSYTTTGQRPPAASIAAYLDRLGNEFGKPGGPGDLLESRQQQVILDWLTALKAGGKLPGIEFGPIVAKVPQTFVHGVAGVGVLLYGDSQASQIAPPMENGLPGTDPVVDNSSPGLVIDVPEFFKGSVSHAMQGIPEWLTQTHAASVGAGFAPDVTNGEGSLFDFQNSQVYYGWPYPPPMSLPGSNSYSCGLPAPGARNMPASLCSIRPPGLNPSEWP
jgi:hypothetical protein